MFARANVKFPNEIKSSRSILASLSVSVPSVLCFVVLKENRKIGYFGGGSGIERRVVGKPIAGPTAFLPHPSRSRAKGRNRSNALFRGRESYSVPSPDSVRAAGVHGTALEGRGKALKVAVLIARDGAPGLRGSAILLGPGSMRAVDRFQAETDKGVDSIGGCPATMGESEGLDRQPQDHPHTPSPDSPVH
nr:hypothetical protein Iba_chr03bCG5720 [Ipomoea batatas]